jgi:hypothetical protein
MTDELSKVRGTSDERNLAEIWKRRYMECEVELKEYDILK